MKSRNNMAVLLLLTLVTVIAFVTPASANGYISGTVLDNAANPINGANVTATNGTDVFYFNTTAANPGVFVITIPTANTPKDYYIEATKMGYYGGGVQLLNVTDGNTTVAQNIVMTKATYPETKIDVAFPTSIPADKGASATVITATIYDQDGNLLVGGSVNSTTIANVNFYLINGTLDVTTGNNGSLANTSGGTLVGNTVTNVPIDAYGEAKVTVYSGSQAGNVQVFNNVSVNNLAGEEVNATIQVVFTPLQGHITGTVRSSEGARLVDAEVSAYRLLWIKNTTTSEWTKEWEYVKTSITDEIGDYVIPFIALKYDYTDGDKDYYYYYDIETVYDDTYSDEAPPFIHPPDNDSYAEPLTNIILVTASKDPYNTGSAYDFVSVDKTQTLDIILTSGQANELLVKISGTQHQLVSDGIQGSEYVVTAALLKDGNSFAIENEDVTLTIDDGSLAKFKANNDVSITVKTAVDGIATTSIVTSTANVGVVTVTGTHTTRDNVQLTDWDSLNVQAGGEISGVVTNEFNVYLPDASVKLKAYNPVTFEYDIYPVKNLEGNNIADEPTNDIGVYTFTKVPSDRYLVSVEYSSLNGFAAPVFVITGTTTANIVIEGAVVIEAPSVTHQYSWYADYNADSSITRNDGLVIGVIVDDPQGLTDISSVTVDASQLGLSSTLSLTKNPGGAWDDSHYMEALDLSALDVSATSGTIVLPVTVEDISSYTGTGYISVTIKEDINPEVIHSVSWSSASGTIFVVYPWDIGTSHIASVKLDALQVGLWDDLDMTYDALWGGYVLFVEPTSGTFSATPSGTYNLNVDLMDTSGNSGTGTLVYTK